MLDSNIRIKIYAKSSVKQMYFYSSIEKGKLLEKIAQKYDLHGDERYKKFATTVGDIILGFYRLEDTVPLLQQELKLDPRTAALLGADVLDFLAPLSDPNWQPPAEDTETQEPDPSEPVVPPQPLQEKPIRNSVPITIAPEEIGGSVLSPSTTRTPITSHSMEVHAITPLPEPAPLSTPLPAIGRQTSPFDTPRPTPPLPPQSLYEHNEPIHQSNQPSISRQIADIPSYNETSAPKSPPPISNNSPRWETE